MNLDELQSVRDRERQTDKLQRLRESFYADAGTLIQQLRTERERVADQAEDPFDAPKVSQLTDEISTAEQMVKAIYEKRIGKIVKAASFDAAGLPAEAEGMTAEEQDLFDRLVTDIEQNRERVLDVIDGTGQERPASTEADMGDVPPGDDRSETVPATAAMGGDEESSLGDDSSDHQSATDTGETPNDESSAKARQPPPEVPAEDDEPVKSADGPGTQPKNSGEPDATRSRSPSDDDNGTVPSQPGSRSSETVPGSGDDSDETDTVREDGGAPSDAATTETGEFGAESDRAADAVDHKTVLVTESIDTFVGFDDRDYDLEAHDVVVLPAANADLLVERDVARELD